MSRTTVCGLASVVVVLRKLKAKKKKIANKVN
jgi:hypothetical protein